MKKEKIVKFDVIENNSMFNDVLSGLNSIIPAEEMMQIKAGKSNPGCTSCSASCVSCASGCAACTLLVL